ncbi:hypothetical protein P9112_000848 [Eukaryota sp. TZLM1-RC]
MKSLLVLTLICLAYATNHNRVVSVAHDSITSPYVGISLGQALFDDIQKIYSHKQRQWKDHLETWHSLAKSALPFIRKYTPHSYREMLGMAKGMSLFGAVSEGQAFEMLLYLNVEYELMFYTNEHLSFDESHGKCTGFMYNREVKISGQTNDETVASWLNGTLDKAISIHYKDEDSYTYIYTHPGYLTYMGSNNKISVLWQYVNAEGAITPIEDGGVPTNVLLRELLFYDCVADAVDFLTSIPRYICNNFQIMDLKSLANVEMTHNRFYISYATTGDLVHANHYVFDDAMVDEDLKKSETSVERYNTIRKEMKARRYDFSVQKAKEILSIAPVLNNKTLASMIFDLEAKIMTIRFMSSPEWITLSRSM